MKHFRRNYTVIGVITLLLGLALWPNLLWHTVKGDALAQIQKRNEIRVGTLYSPLTYQDSSQAPSGLDYELSEYFAHYLRVKLKITVYKTTADLFNALQNGEVDMISAGLTYTNEREKQFIAGPSYYVTSEELAYHLGESRPHSLADIKEPIIVAAESSHANTLAHLQSKYPNLQWKTTTEASSQEILLAVAEGKLNYTIADAVAVSLLQRIHPKLTVAFDVSKDESIVWYIQRPFNDNLYAAMLDFFSEVDQTDVLTRLEEKYLGHVRSFDYVDTKTFLDAVKDTLPKYESLFKKYSGTISWELLAAIAYQESHWNPLATSPTGVRGIMMLTQSTADSVGIGNRLDPEQSIKGGAKYLQELIDKIPSSIADDQKIWFALAAYNMGYGHMLDARTLTKRLGSNPDNWADVKKSLPLLTQRRYYTHLRYGFGQGSQAYKYVENIRRYLDSLNGYLAEKEHHFAQKSALSQDYPVVKPQEILSTS